jgi:hypothetical protein
VWIHDLDLSIKIDPYLGVRILLGYCALCTVTPSGG